MKSLVFRKWSTIQQHFCPAPLEELSEIKIKKSPSATEDDPQKNYLRTVVPPLHALPQVSCSKDSVTKKYLNSKATFSSIEEIYDEEVVTLANKKITCKKNLQVKSKQ